MSARCILILALAGTAGAMASCAGPAAPTTMPTTQPVIAGDPALDGAVDLVMRGQYFEAAKVLERLVGGYRADAEPLHSSQAMYWLGYCKEKTGNPAEAAKWYRQVIARYPTMEAARLAQDRLDGLPAQ
jgi:TolA-binding protein